MLRRGRGDPIQQPQGFPEVRAPSGRQQGRDFGVHAALGLGKVAGGHPHGLLRHDEETGRERIAEQLAAGLHHAAVLGLVAEAVEFVQRREERGLARLGRVTVAWQDRDADHQGLASEHHVRQVTRHIDDDAAAGASRQAKDHADHGLRARGFDARPEASQGLLQRALAVVIAATIKRLGIGAPGAGAVRRAFSGRKPGAAGLAPGSHRIFELQEATQAREPGEKVVGGWNVERDDLDVGPAGRQCRGRLAHALQILLADIDDESGHLGSRRRQRSERLGNHGGTSLADADQIYAERHSLVLSDAVNATPQSIELPLFELGIHG